MNSFNIYMKSLTQAQKSRGVLARSGIRSEIIRETGKNGCVFRLRVTVRNGGREEVCALLRKAGIPCDIS
jgi:hypothetical protein